VQGGFFLGEPFYLPVCANGGLFSANLAWASADPTHKKQEYGARDNSKGEKARA
jgi:hypothetical protein